MTGNAVPELEEREQLTIGNVASELEDRGSTGVTGTVSQADSAATKMLVAMIGAWAERNGHALAYAPKSVQVRVDGGDVLLSLFPSWDAVYFEVGKLRGLGMESAAETILGHLRVVGTRPVTR